MKTFGNLGGTLSPVAFGLSVKYLECWTVPFLIAAILCLLSVVLWMRIDPEQSPFPAQGAKMRISERKCVVCGNCVPVCPTAAIEPDELNWPRVVRRAFSDPLVSHESTGVYGTLLPGRQAGFVVLDASPLEDIRNSRKIAPVWQRGIQVRGPILASLVSLASSSFPR